MDRLSMWVGSLSSDNSRRCIRMGTKRIMSSIEGETQVYRVRLSLLI